MKVLVVAGEASGDLHAAAAVRALRARVPDLECFGLGGGQVRAAGVDTLYDAASISVMGITEVIGTIPHVFAVIDGLAEAAESRRPDVALLVDLPDFNLRLARRLRELRIPVVLYVSPTVWAWREGRVKLLKRDLHQVLCIYPFEEPYLRERGVNALYVGNPLLDEEAGVTHSTLAVTPDGLVLREVAPGVSARDVQERTGPTLKVSSDLCSMPTGKKA